MSVVARASPVLCTQIRLSEPDVHIEAVGSNVLPMSARHACGGHLSRARRQSDIRRTVDIRQVQLFFETLVPHRDHSMSFAAFPANTHLQDQTRMITVTHYLRRASSKTSGTRQIRSPRPREPDPFRLHTQITVCSGRKSRESCRLASNASALDAPAD